MTLREELDMLADATVSLARQREPLRSVELAAADARHDGRFGEHAVAWTTQIWQGSDRIERLQIARVTGDDDCMGTLTLLVLPRAETGAPILGIDLVGFKGALTFVAYDLHPAGRSLGADSVAHLEQVRARLLAIGTPRDTEHGPFSQHAIVASLARGHDPSTATASYLRYLDCCFDELARPPTNRCAEGRGHHARYLAKMTEHMCGVVALQKLFGAAWIADYFTRVFFAPIAIPESHAIAPARSHPCV